MKNNKGNNDMIKMTHNFRVYIHANGSFNAFANFTSIQEALDYMRNWTDKTDSYGYLDKGWKALVVEELNKGFKYALLVGDEDIDTDVSERIFDLDNKYYPKFFDLLVLYYVRN